MPHIEGFKAKPIKQEPRDPRQHWSTYAACKETDPELFYLPANIITLKQKQERQALCDNCPVLNDCHDSVLQEEEKQNKEDLAGFRAGMTPSQRREIFSRRKNKSS